MKRIVKIMLEQGEVTASDIAHISNSNQYFVALERLGIIGSRWHTRANGTKCKMRFIKDRAKALKFIGKPDEYEAAKQAAEAIEQYVSELKDKK